MIFAVYFLLRREWSRRRRFDSETTILSPGERIEFDILVVDQTFAVDPSQDETLDIWVRTLADAIESPLPDELVTFDCEAKGVDLTNGWSGKGVLDVGFSVGLN